MVVQRPLKRDGRHLSIQDQAGQFKRLRDGEDLESNSFHGMPTPCPHESLIQGEPWGYDEKADNFFVGAPSYAFPLEASAIDSFQTEDSNHSTSPQSSFSGTNSSDITAPSQSELVPPGQGTQSAFQRVADFQPDHDTASESSKSRNASSVASDLSTNLKPPKVDTHSCVSRTTRYSTRITAASGTVEVGDVKALEEYFYSRCAAMLVNPCKPVAAKIIDLLCPEKKQEHPYLNPKKPELFQGQPDWWPERIKYESPHHMRKKDLLSFLCYLLTLPHRHRPCIKTAVEKGKFSNWRSLLESTLTDLDLHDNREETDKDRREFDDKRHRARLEVVGEMYRVSGYAAECAEGLHDKDHKVTYEAVPEICFRDSKKKSRSSYDSMAPHESLLEKPAPANITAGSNEREAKPEEVDETTFEEIKPSLDGVQRRLPPASINVVSDSALEWQGLDTGRVEPPLGFMHGLHAPHFGNTICASPPPATQEEALGPVKTENCALQHLEDAWGWPVLESGQTDLTQLAESFDVPQNPYWYHDFVGASNCSYDTNNRLLQNQQLLLHETTRGSHGCSYVSGHPMYMAPYSSSGCDGYTLFADGPACSGPISFCSCNNHQRLLPSDCSAPIGVEHYMPQVGVPKMLSRSVNLKQSVCEPDRS